MRTRPFSSLPSRAIHPPLARAQGNSKLSPFTHSLTRPVRAARALALYGSTSSLSPSQSAVLAARVRARSLARSLALVMPFGR